MPAKIAALRRTDAVRSDVFPILVPRLQLSDFRPDHAQQVAVARFFRDLLIDDLFEGGINPDPVGG